MKAYANIGKFSGASGETNRGQPRHWASTAARCIDCWRNTTSSTLSSWRTPRKGAGRALRVPHQRAASTLCAAVPIRPKVVRKRTRNALSERRRRTSRIGLLYMPMLLSASPICPNSEASLGWDSSKWWIVALSRSTSDWPRWGGLV